MEYAKTILDKELKRLEQSINTCTNVQTTHNIKQKKLYEKQTLEIKKALALFDVCVSFLYDFVNEFTDTEIPKEAIKESLNSKEETIGTNGILVDLFNKELTQEEWNALCTVHRLSERLSVGIRFDWSKSIDVRGEDYSQIIDESIFLDRERK